MSYEKKIKEAEKLLVIYQRMGEGLIIKSLRDKIKQLKTKK